MTVRPRVDDLDIADLLDGLGVGVLAGVGGVDVVGVLGQEQRLGADLRGAQGGGRIGREEGAARFRRRR